jgi:hypothetical protein
LIERQPRRYACVRPALILCLICSKMSTIPSLRVHSLCDPSLYNLNKLSCHSTVFCEALHPPPANVVCTEEYTPRIAVASPGRADFDSQTRKRSFQHLTCLGRHTKRKRRVTKLRDQASPRDSRGANIAVSRVGDPVMPTLAINNFNIVCATLGGFITLFGLVSYLMKEKFYLSEACKYCHLPYNLASSMAQIRREA